MLREEIMQNIRETYRTEMVIAIAAATVYSWLLLHKQDVPRIAWFIPPCLIFAATIRVLNLWLTIRFIVGYLRCIEEATFGDDTNLPGWERYISAGRHHPFAIICNTLAVSLWVVALAVSIGGSWLLSR